MSDSIEHGTYAGWNHHRRAGVEPCSDCRDAARRYMNGHRLARGRAPYYFPVEWPEPPIDGLGATIARSFRESA